MSQATPVYKDLDLFARVKDGKIVEFPVYYMHIRNRNHPVSRYTRVVEGPKPDVPKFHHLTQKVEIIGRDVVVSYQAVPTPLSAMLSTLLTMNDEGELQALPITEVEPETIEHIYTQVSDYIHDRLDEFARTRGYNSLDSLIGKYRDSAVPKFAAEAARGRELLDQTWANQLQYFEEILSGAVPVPTSIADINARIPEMTWADEVTEEEEPAEE